MLEKTKNILQHPFWLNFRDVRVLGFLVFGVLVLLTSLSGANIIQTNYQLQKQIIALQQQSELQRLENDNLKLQNEYYDSTTYQELTVRQQFSKGLPGETLVLVPTSVALKYAPPLPRSSQPTVKIAVDNRPTYKKNFSAWIDFLFHRSSL